MSFLLTKKPEIARGESDGIKAFFRNDFLAFISIQSPIIVSHAKSALLQKWEKKEKEREKEWFTLWIGRNGCKYCGVWRAAIAVLDADRCGRRERLPTSCRRPSAVTDSSRERATGTWREHRRRRGARSALTAPLTLIEKDIAAAAIHFGCRPTRSCRRSSPRSPLQPLP